MAPSEVALTTAGKRSGESVLSAVQADPASALSRRDDRQFQTISPPGRAILGDAGWIVYVGEVLQCAGVVGAVTDLPAQVSLRFLVVPSASRTATR